jgi:hypothetical protein
MARGRCHSMDNPPEATTDELAANANASEAPSDPDTVIELSSTTLELLDAEASGANTSTQCAPTVSPEHTARPLP